MDSDMGKRLGQKVCGRYWELAANQRWSLLEVRM